LPTEKDAKILGKTENGWTKANNAALAAIIIAFKVKPFGWNNLQIYICNY